MDCSWLIHWKPQCTKYAKPRVSLTAPNCDHFLQVSLMVLDFLDAIAEAKKLICESIAHNLKQVLLTKSFLASAMEFNLLLSNLTAVAKAKKPLCQWNSWGYFFQFATKSHELEPRLKLMKLFCQWLGGDRQNIIESTDKIKLKSI